MKKLFIATILAIGLSSCSQVLLRQPEVLTSSFIDYSKYTNAGFFITEANSVSFEYKTLGNVTGINLSGYQQEKNVTNSSTEKQKDDVYTNTSNKPYRITNKYINATKEKALEELVLRAKSLGANGVINLKFETFSQTSQQGAFELKGYSVSGLAIKR